MHYELCIMNCELSILIPNYNNRCVALVSELLRQAEAIEGLAYEVIVADDASTDPDTLSHNQALLALPHTRYLRRTTNVGRAAIRNFLVQQASFARLLFIDSGMSVTPDLLRRYVNASGEVVYGGYRVAGDERLLGGNLRYRYEKRAEPNFVAARRQLSPYHDFHASNFLVGRDTMLHHPFNEQFRHYGYEDVMLGREFESARIPINHIDNPVLFNEFEANEVFLAKTEEALRTLHSFRCELQQHSRLLALCGRLRRWHIAPLLLLIFRHMKNGWRRQVVGSHPSLLLFQLYKAVYLLQLEDL